MVGVGARVHVKEEGAAGGEAQAGEEAGGGVEAEIAVCGYCVCHIEVTSASIST